MKSKLFPLEKEDFDHEQTVKQFKRQNSHIYVAGPVFQGFCITFAIVIFENIFFMFVCDPIIVICPKIK